jgi:hypothetical protein
MKKVRDFEAVYGRLRAILARHAAGLVVLADDGKEYTLVTGKTDKAGKPTYFASIRLGKAYVGYHLVSLYTNPGLIEGCSDALVARKQGKTCFNFSDIDEALFAEVAELTERCLTYHREAGLV